MQYRHILATLSNIITDDIFNVQEKTTKYNDTPELGQNPKSLSNTSDDTSDEVDTSDEADTSDEPPDNSDEHEHEPEPEASTEFVTRSPWKSDQRHVHLAPP